MIPISRLKLRQQLTVLITIALVMMILIQVVYYFRFYTLTKERARIYASNMMNQVEEQLGTVVRNIEEGGFTIAYNRHVQEYLVTSDPERRIVKLFPFVQDVMGYVKSSDGNIYDIMLINQEGKIITSMYGYQYDIFQTLTDQYGFTEKEFKTPTHTSIIMDQEQSFYYYAYILPIISNTQRTDLFDKIGTVLIICRTTPLEKMVLDISLTPNSLFLILDKDNKVVAGNHKGIQGQTFNDLLPEEEKFQQNEVEYNSKKSIVQYKTIDNIDWKIVSIIPVDELTSDMEPIKGFGLMIGVIMAILLLIIGIVFSRSITKPISQLVLFMENIGEHNIKQRLEMPMPNEVGTIAKDINKMLDKVEAMTRKIFTTQTKLYETELTKKQTELSALQSQINPHFLYNTLNCLSSIGLAHDVMEIVHISSAMSRIFKYCIREVELVPIQDEINCIHDYLHIMSIRYGGKFSSTIDIEDGLMEMKTIKMILQPIVENAIYHGLERKLGKGKLFIKGEREENQCICFMIHDDGKGMEDNELRDLQCHIQGGIGEEEEEELGKRSIGLVNINKRIKLTFGEEYGLSIESKREEGTIVYVKFPLMK